MRIGSICWCVLTVNMSADYILREEALAMNIAIIFAGGSGVRMGAGIPKQFLEIDGKPS